jgi:hypothetical protein
MSAIVAGHDLEKEPKLHHKRKVEYSERQKNPNEQQLQSARKLQTLSPQR